MLNNWINWFLQKRNFATILLVLFLTQFVWIEGYTISYVKVGMMALCPILLLIHRPQINKAMIFGGVYYVYVVLTASFHPDTFRASTLIYLLLYILMYILFYSFVHAGAFSLEYFTKVVKYMIFAYCICLILQQISTIIGIRFMPLINLNNQHYLSLFKLPSLALEPSHSARILGVLFYAYLKCNEFKYGHKMQLSSLFSKENRLVTYTFLWPMLTMGSGTAFLSMGILSLYFMQGRQLFWSIPVFIGVFFILEFFEVQQAKRVSSVVVATATLNSQEVMDTDGSAAVRIKPLLNTLRIDLTKKENWFGRGCDAGLQHGLYGDDRYVKGISDYGFISYILSWIFALSCGYNFLSLPTLMCMLGVGGGLGNIAFSWGNFMLFTCVIFFCKNRQPIVSSCDETAISD